MPKIFVILIVALSISALDMILKEPVVGLGEVTQRQAHQFYQKIIDHRHIYMRPDA